MNTTSRAVCEAVRSDRANGKGNKSNENRFLFGGSGVREAVLRKRVSPVFVFNSFDVLLRNTCIIVLTRYVWWLSRANQIR